MADGNPPDGVNGLGIKQTRLARLFDVGVREVRRWKSGARRLPRGVGIVLQLLAGHIVTLGQIEEAAARTNGHADPEPPAELTTAQKLLRLEPGGCKWPDGEGSGLQFCGQPVVAVGKPYCDFHLARATLRRPERPQMPKPRAILPRAAPELVVFVELEPAELELDAALEADAPQIELCARYETIPVELAG